MAATSPDNPVVAPAHSADQHDESPLYTPPSPHTSRTAQLIRTVNAQHALALDSYHDLYRWSTTHIDAFWSLVWDETGVIGHKGAHIVDNAALPADNPTWFADARVNWAENMLRCRSADKVALIQASAYAFPSATRPVIDDSTTMPSSAEPTPEVPNPPLHRVTYAELYALVADLVSALLVHDLKPGDRVASYSSNCIVGVLFLLPRMRHPLSSSLDPKSSDGRNLNRDWLLGVVSAIDDMNERSYSGSRDMSD